MTELLKFPSHFVSQQFVKYIDREEIDSITTQLAEKVSERYRGEELIIIGVLKGSMIFMSDLVKHIKGVKIYVDFVSVGAVGRSKENQGSIVLKKDLGTSIFEKNVLIVEEIIDTGRALHFLKERFSLANPRNLNVLTLFDKPYKRLAPITADFIGKKIDDQFVVGYGLDLEEFGRNINDLYYLKYPN
jgi:hypoxanthine phosphoribosyltransferase